MAGSPAAAPPTPSSSTPSPAGHHPRYHTRKSYSHRDLQLARLNGKKLAVKVTVLCFGLEQKFCIILLLYSEFLHAEEEDTSFEENKNSFGPRFCKCTCQCCFQIM